MSYKKERSMKLQDKVKRLLAANAELRETIKAKDKAIEAQKNMIEKMKCCDNCAEVWNGECSLSTDEKLFCLKKTYLNWSVK